MKKLMTIAELKTWRADNRYTAKELDESIEKFYINAEKTKNGKGCKLIRIFAEIDLCDFDGGPVGYEYVYRTATGRTMIEYRRNLG